MAEITLHVGMPKTGSSSIQAWLRQHAHVLSDRDTLVATAFPDDDGAIVVAPLGPGRPSSAGGVVPALRDPATAAAAAVEFVDGVLVLADRHPRVVLSGEALSEAFWRPLPTVLEQFDRLGRDHACRIAYYLRPQHEALEAGWRQWGFRMGRTPSAFMASWSPRLDYRRPLRARARTPHLDVVFRPCQAARLDAGDVVTDFVQRFVTTDVPVAPTWANAGLPLAIVNLLATMPPGSLWDSEHDNSRFNRIRRVLGDVAAADPDVARGQQVLIRWAHDHFAAANADALGRLGWDLFGWIPDDGGHPRDVELLDDLWRPRASPAEQAVVHRLLTTLVE